MRVLSENSFFPTGRLRPVILYLDRLGIRFARQYVERSSKMNYICIDWKHNFADEPIKIYSEVDSQGWERRKIEIFRDGSMAFASPSYHFGDSYLSEAQLPSLSEINSDPQFRGRKIDPTEFGRLWSQFRNGN